MNRMNSGDLSYMTIPELLAAMRQITDELELRCMETAGETPRMVCGDTGETCVWCTAKCKDRRPELE